MKAGIIGCGRFGKLFVKYFDKYFQFEIYDLSFSLPAGEKKKLFDNFSKCEYIFFAVPISKLEDAAIEISPYVNINSLVADLCSIQEFPLSVLKKYFPNNEVVSLHPLFGPESVTDRLKEHQLIMTYTQKRSERCHELENIFIKEGLKIIEMSAEEHDRQMAWTLCLTQFIGRGLGKLDLPKNQIGTKGYFDLYSIVTRANADTMELFLDMNKFNRFSDEMRKKVIEEFTKLNLSIDDHDSPKL